jgi:2'-5' RNA ligase
MSAEARRRVFFALWPDAACARALATLARRAAPAEARRMRRDTLHLTLAFIGDIAAARLPELMAVGDRMRWPALMLRLDRIGHWDHNRIIWAGASAPPAALEALASALADALADIGVDCPRRPFVPHVTLARKATSLAMAPADMPPIDWPVGGGVLVASERDDRGARYRALRAWPAATGPD